MPRSWDGSESAPLGHAAGNGAPVVWIMVDCAAVDAIRALLWLKPLARRTVEHSRQMQTHSAPAWGGE